MSNIMDVWIRNVDLYFVLGKGVRSIVCQESPCFDHARKQLLCLSLVHHIIYPISFLAHVHGKTIASIINLIRETHHTIVLHTSSIRIIRSNVFLQLAQAIELLLLQIILSLYIKMLNKLCLCNSKKKKFDNN